VIPNNLGVRGLLIFERTGNYACFGHSKEFDVAKCEVTVRVTM